MIKQISYFILMLLLLVACSKKTKKPRVFAGDDTLTSGIIHISVDESFQPIIDSQLKVFLSQHPNAKIIPHYAHLSIKLRWQLFIQKLLDTSDRHHSGWLV